MKACIDDNYEKKLILPYNLQWFADGDAGEKKEPAKEAVKTGVLNILKETYDFEEEDFLSAELEIVPAGKAREAGFDRSIILGYGQDDRVCAYASIKALLGSGDIEKTAVCRDGEIVVALIEDEATVKRLSRKNGEIWLLPENPAFDPINGSEAEIIGIVKGVFREY